jgi:predicted TIM-barrel fold metal-dependent hydrolase
VKLNLPLLCHVGAEHAIPSPEPEDQYRQFDEPMVLVPALEEGVKVIAAHCAMPVFSWDSDYTQDFIGLMGRALQEGWNLYSDVSALAGPFPHRMGILKKMVRELPHDRLLLGSDYPIPVTPLWPGVGAEIDLDEWADAMLTRNPLDRNVKVVRALGFSEQILTNAEKVLLLS